MGDGDSSMQSILPQSRGKMDKYPTLTNNRIVNNYAIANVSILICKVNTYID